MFPRTCALLLAANISLTQFIPFWFDKPRLEQDDYDFFLLKIDRFVEFVIDALSRRLRDCDGGSEKNCAQPIARRTSRSGRTR